MSFGQNNNINLTEYPITFVNGGYRNLFRGFRENKIKLTLKDATITNIVEDTGKIQITTTSPSALMVLDAKITIVGGLYDGETGIITTAASPNFVVDIDFIGDDNTTSSTFVNRLDNNYKLEYRFVDSRILNVQTGVPVLTQNTYTVFNNLEGVYEIDVRLISELFRPTLEASEINDKMSGNFQVQIREIESGAALGTWETITDTGLPEPVGEVEPFILNHSTAKNIYMNSFDNQFLDKSLESRIWKSYNKVIVFLANSSNKTLSGSIAQKEYTQDKQLVAVSSIPLTPSNGLNGIEITIQNNTARYVELIETISNTNINLTIYDTLLNETEYYITWISEQGSLRSWLFNARTEFQNNLDVLEISETTFRNIPTERENVIILRTAGLSKNELDYLLDVKQTNLMKLENNGETFECRIDDLSTAFENKTNTYNLELEVLIKPIETMRV